MIGHMDWNPADPRTYNAQSIWYSYAIVSANFSSITQVRFTANTRNSVFDARVAKEGKWKFRGRNREFRSASDQPHEIADQDLEDPSNQIVSAKSAQIGHTSLVGLDSENMVFKNENRPAKRIRISI